MSVIQLLDGSQHIVFNSKDLIDIAYDKLGIEYSNLIENITETQEENEIYAKERLNTDLNSYEGQIEEYRDCMLEVQEILEKLEETIEESKRLNREEILKQIRISIHKLNAEL